MQAAALKTFVLAHGSWHGGWCWKRVAHRLREKGHAVYAPSFTGMGDRVHLLNREITIDTFVEDLAQVILTEELNRVLLVGHSFGGIPISGVADRFPERIAHLIYLDAVITEPEERLLLLSALRVDAGTDQKNAELKNFIAGGDRGRPIGHSFRGELISFRQFSTTSFHARTCHSSFMST